MMNLRNRRGTRSPNHDRPAPAAANKIGSLSQCGRHARRLYELKFASRSKRQSLGSRGRRRGQSGHTSQKTLKNRCYERVQVWLNVVTGLTAILALALSAFTYLQLNHEVPIQMVMPRVLRIGQGIWTNLYVQPIFTVTKKTDVAEVISSVKITLRGPVGTKPADFYWYGSYGLNGDPKNYSVNLQFFSDPTPMIVTQETPQHPVLDFRTTYPALSAGRWTGFLTAEQQGQPPLVEPFCIDISSSDLQKLEAPTSDWFYFRTDQPSDVQGSSRCYVWGF